MQDNLVLQLAKLRVHEYADESVDEIMARHQDAMERRDCEEFLQRGIDAAKFLRIAESILRDADYRGIAPFSTELQNAIDALYGAWLHPCDAAEKWNLSLVARGYTPDNLDDFRRTCAEMQEAIERKDWQSRAALARDALSASEPW